jgi:hypothetical protein
VKITVFRVRFHETRTVGQLYLDGTFFCFTLEDKVREVKVKNETAIPSGKYEVTLETSPKFGPDTITIHSVPGFEGIRIHSGNTEHHTEGCPIVGYRLNDDGTIAFGSTKPALADLKKKIKEALDNGERVSIEIANMH